MFSIKDLNDNKHPYCPRCKSEWEDESGDSSIFHCPNCQMFALSYIDIILPNEYYLNFALYDDEKEYVISWDKGRCQVEVKDHNSLDSYIYSYMYLPLLPFDITLEKLKLYITFS